MAFPSDLVRRGMDGCCQVRREGKADLLENHKVEKGCKEPASPSAVPAAGIVSGDRSLEVLV